MENWLPIPGYEGYYEVSDQGRVRSVDRVVSAVRNGASQEWKLRGRMISQRLSNGYAQVTLSKTAVHVHPRVHLLVLTAHIGPRPDGMQGLHWDDDRTNNSITNLYWGTPSDNMHDQVRNGKHHGALKTECIRGHRYTPENTIHRPKGRKCRQCARDKSRDWATQKRRARGVPIKGPYKRKDVA